MFGVVAGDKAGHLSPETRKLVLTSSVRHVAEELRSMPAVLPELSAEQLAALKAVLTEAQLAIDVFEDHRAVLDGGRSQT